MPRKYIRLCLNSAEIDHLTQSGIKLNAIAHQAIANWETIAPEKRQELMRDRQILYIKEPLTIKTIGSDRVISSWLASSEITNESLTLSSAIGSILNQSLYVEQLMVPVELADRLRSIGGDPLEHLQVAINKYLISS
jgi:hypothetical protein